MHRRFLMTAMTCCVAVALKAVPARATIFDWAAAPPGDGDFEDGSNWEPLIAGPPGPLDTAVFNHPGADGYTVNFDSDPTNDRLVVGDDDVTLRLARRGIFDIPESHTYTLTNGSISIPSIIVGESIGQRGHLTIVGVGTSPLGTGTLSGVNCVIGQNNGTTGEVTVGANGIWQNSGDLTVGQSGTGTLTIQDGGSVSSNSGAIGVEIDSEGNVTVDGLNSNWTSPGALDVGGSGTGTLTIQNGGTISNNSGTIGNGSGSEGNVTVDGLDSNWTNSGSLLVGVFGTGTLAIQNGGVVSNAGTGDGTIGFSIFVGDSQGTVTVDGVGSSWKDVDRLTVGSFSMGTLFIQNGGNVSNVVGKIGSQGMATVDGLDSNWTNSGTLDIGGGESLAGGIGSLSITNGGLATVADTLKIWSGGTVNLDGGTLSADSIDHTLGGSFNFTAGTLKLNNFQGELFNQGGTLAPGTSLGIATITDDYIQFAAGTLEIEMAGADNSDPAAPQYDAVSVGDIAIIDGTVKLVLLDGFTPTDGDAFVIFSAGTTLIGTFNTLNANEAELGLNAGGWQLEWLIDYEHAALVELLVGVRGDMDLDGDVDFDDIDDFVQALNNPAEYLAAFGHGGSAPGDMDFDFELDFDDISGFVDRLSDGSPLSGGTSAIPEPCGLTLALIGLLGLVGWELTKFPSVFTRAHRSLSSIGLLVLGLLPPLVVPFTQTHGADVESTWFGGTGNWSVDGNWSNNPGVGGFPNNGNEGFTYDAVVGGGTATLDLDITIEKLTLAGGSITGGSDLTLSILDWRSGTMTGSGQSSAASGSFNTGWDKALSRRLEITGPFGWSSGNIRGTGGELWVKNNGSFDISGTDTRTLFSGVTVTTELGGTITKAGSSTRTVRGTLTNDGLVEVNDGTLQSTGPFTNYDADTNALTGGTYNIAARFQFQNADININRADITLDGPSSQIVDQSDVNALADLSLNDTGAHFGAINNRNFTTAAAFVNRGTLEIGGGTIDAISLTNEATGEIFGFGTIMPLLQNSGTVRAVGGVLTASNGIQASSGTVQIDASSALDLGSASGESGADLLVHNGDDLNLGSNNFIVGTDYTNATFGAGNSFDPRANVSGAGEIRADGDVLQALSGDIGNGNTATATMSFGNVHVGDVSALNYRINNDGTTGPSLRGAIQTSAGGGNITDPRLSGAGVTAANFGPIATGSDSGDLAVIFTAPTAGDIAPGQTVHLVNNLGNVANQDLQIGGTAYRLADPSDHTPEPVDFGIVHVGEIAEQALSLSNQAANDGFSESLNASYDGTTGDATAAGSFNLLSPGATDNTSLVVGIDTSSAGAKTGTAKIDFMSDGAGTSSLGQTPLPGEQQTVNVAGLVNNFAAPLFRRAGGDGSFTRDAANDYTLDFGTIFLGGANPVAELELANDVLAPADELAGDYTDGTPAEITLSGFGPFAGLTAGNSLAGQFVELDTSTLGLVSGTITLNPLSENPNPFSAALLAVTITVAGDVVVLLGDLDCDGDVDFDDIPAFVLGLRNATAYELMFGVPPTLKGDMDRDGDFDFDDIPGFVSTFRGGTVSDTRQAVPEPSTIVLVALLGLVSWAKSKSTKGALALRYTRRRRHLAKRVA